MIEYLSESELEKWRESNYLERQIDDRVKFSHLVMSVTLVQKAPRTMDMEIRSWDMECYKCHTFTPVVFPRGDFFGHAAGFDSLAHLPSVLSTKFPFFKKTHDKTVNGEAYGNICRHCNAHIGDFFVFEDSLGFSYDTEAVHEISTITVPLTGDERIYYATIDPSWFNRARNETNRLS